MRRSEAAQLRRSRLRTRAVAAVLRSFQAQMAIPENGPVLRLIQAAGGDDHDFQAGVFLESLEEMGYTVVKKRPGKD